MARIATVNFTEQVDGDTFLAKSVNFFIADGTTPLDLSDATPRIQIRKSGYNGRLVAELTVGDGIEWVVRANGTLQFGSISTATWGGAGSYFYDLELTYGTSGTIRTYLRGEIKLIDDATGTQQTVDAVASTTIVGVLSTQAEFDAACIDGNFQYDSDFTGTPDGTKFLRDDKVWTTISGGGDALVANPLSQFAATTLAQLNGVITDATFVDGVETGADVTDTTNVTAAGALMDSELTSITDVKALNQSVVSGATPTFTNTNFTEATDKNYVTDAEAVVIGNTSGTNTGDSQTLANGVSDVTATAAELNLLDLAGLTAGHVLSADTATTASWKAAAGGGGGSVYSFQRMYAMDYNNTTAWMSTNKNIGASLNEVNFAAGAGNKGNSTTTLSDAQISNHGYLFCAPYDMDISLFRITYGNLPHLPDGVSLLRVVWSNAQTTTSTKQIIYENIGFTLSSLEIGVIEITSTFSNTRLNKGDFLYDFHSSTNASQQCDPTEIYIECTPV